MCIKIFVSIFKYFSFQYCSFTFKLLVAFYIQIFVTEMDLPSTPINSIPNHGEKPERFNGTDFKR